MIWIITSHNNGFRAQPLRLPRFVDKLTPSSLHKRDPGIIRIRFVRARHADLRTALVIRRIRWLVAHETRLRRISAPTRIPNNLINATRQDHRVWIRFIFARNGKGVERNDVTQKWLLQVETETGGSGGEGDGRRSVDDGYATVEAPPREEDSAFGALGLCLGEAEQEAIGDRGGVCQEWRRARRGGEWEAKERGRKGEGKSPGQEEGEEEAGWGKNRDHRIHLGAIDMKDGADIKSRGMFSNFWCNSGELAGQIRKKSGARGREQLDGGCVCRTTPVSSRAPSPKPSARRRTRQSPLPPWPMGKIGYSQGNTSADLLRQRWNQVGQTRPLLQGRVKISWRKA